MSRRLLVSCVLGGLGLLLTASRAGAAQSYRTEIPSTRELPPSVLDSAGEKVELEGTLEIFVEDRLDGSRRLTFLHLDSGERYTLSFDSEPARLLTGDRVRVRGLRVDQTVVVESGSGNTELLSGAGTESLQATSALPNSFGAQKTVVLLINFSDEATQPYTKSSAQSVVFTTTNNFDLENSYGQTWLTGDVFGWYTISLSSTVCDYATLASQANSAASTAGVNLSNYSHYVYAFPQNACGWWGLGSVGGNPSQAWINGNLQLQVVAHEMGHNFGLYHSHSLDCGSVTLGGTCIADEYGDTLDNMGYSSYHFNAFQKERLGWLSYGSSPPITTVTSSGTYSIDAYETVGSAPKALKIAQGTTGSYFYVELRQGLGFDGALGSNANITSGVVVHLASPADPNSSDLLDMTPATASWTDPALHIGQSFSDSGVTIVVNSLGSTNASVAVTLGPDSPPPLDTTQPAAAVTGPAAGAIVSGSVAVTASASDNVGVARVDFYRDGGVMLGSSASAPYAVTWDTTTVSPGSHSLYARAVDAAGNTGTSAVQTVTVASGDTTPPTVTIASPTNGATFSRKSTVTLAATALDNVGVTRVEFFVNGVLLSTDTSSPFSSSWKVPAKANATYGLQAKAYDAAGNVSVSAVLTVYAK